MFSCSEGIQCDDASRLIVENKSSWIWREQAKIGCFFSDGQDVMSGVPGELVLALQLLTIQMNHLEEGTKFADDTKKGKYVN